MKRTLIKTDGSETTFDKPLRINEIAELLGAKTLDSVTLHHLGLPRLVMMLDDRGYDTAVSHHHDGVVEIQPVRALKPVNEKATALYHVNCVPGVEHQVVGDVFICPDDDFA